MYASWCSHHIIPIIIFMPMVPQLVQRTRNIRRYGWNMRRPSDADWRRMQFMKRRGSLEVSDKRFESRCLLGSDSIRELIPHKNSQKSRRSSIIILDEMKIPLHSSHSLQSKAGQEKKCFTGTWWSLLPLLFPFSPELQRDGYIYLEVRIQEEGKALDVESGDEWWRKR